MPAEKGPGKCQTAQFENEEIPIWLTLKTRNSQVMGSNFSPCTDDKTNLKKKLIKYEKKSKKSEEYPKADENKVNASLTSHYRARKTASHESYNHLNS